MGLLSGSASVARFQVFDRPREPDFDALAFEPIPPGSERRESAGFVPMEPEAPYRIGDDLFAFRLRFDRIRPDPTAVAERADALARAELGGSGLATLPSARRKELKALAADEIARATPPRTAFVEGVLEGATVYLGTTARARLGAAALLLRQLGVHVRPATPWAGTDTSALEPPWLRLTEPGASVLGCRFLAALIEEGEVMAEPVDGAARLATPDLRVALAGAVHVELFRLLEAGAELLAARLLTEQGRFRFEAPTFRVASLELDVAASGGWIERLDARLEPIRALFELLDARYAALAARFAESARQGAAAGDETLSPAAPRA
jgi:hypothetical protein